MNEVELNERQIIDDLTQRLANAYTEVDPSHVAEVVDREYARFDGRPIRDFIPLFVERKVHEQMLRRQGLQRHRESVDLTPVAS
jgi:hypothetical protein